MVSYRSAERSEKSGCRVGSGEAGPRAAELFHDLKEFINAKRLRGVGIPPYGEAALHLSSFLMGVVFMIIIVLIIVSPFSVWREA